MHHSIYTPANFMTFTNLDWLGPAAIGQHLRAAKAKVLCEVTNSDPWCRTCGDTGSHRDTVISRLAHEPFGCRPTVLAIKHSPALSSDWAGL